MRNCLFPAVTSQNLSQPLDQMDQIGTGLIQLLFCQIWRWPTEDDKATVFDDKSVEGGQKPVCYEGATSYKSGTIFEELAERAKEEVEVHIPEVLPREELIEEAKAEAKADFSRFLYLS